MHTILNVFGRSPFASLQKHLACVARCIEKLPALFEAVEKNERVLIAKIAEEISTTEHEADVIKNDIRNHLPKSLVLPIKHGNLLEFLTILDRIADKAEDAAVLTTLKPLKILPEFREIFHLFLEKNIAAFEEVRLIMRELHELIESSFGGIEAEKVRSMVEEVASREHEVDLIQHRLLQKLFEVENQLSYGDFMLWQKIFENIGALSNLSENLAYRVRATLELE